MSWAFFYLQFARQFIETIFPFCFLCCRRRVAITRTLLFSAFMPGLPTRTLPSRLSTESGSTRTRGASGVSFTTTSFSCGSTSSGIDIDVSVDVSFQRNINKLSTY